MTHSWNSELRFITLKTKSKSKTTKKANMLLSDDEWGQILVFLSVQEIVVLSCTDSLIRNLVNRIPSVWLQLKERDFSLDAQRLAQQLPCFDIIDGDSYLLMSADCCEPMRDYARIHVKLIYPPFDRVKNRSDFSLGGNSKQEVAKVLMCVQNGIMNRKVANVLVNDLLDLPGLPKVQSMNKQ